MAGVVMAVRCAVVILGTSKPLLVETISNAAELSGVVVLIPTFCEYPFMAMKKVSNNVSKFVLDIL